MSTKWTRHFCLNNMNICIIFVFKQHEPMKKKLHDYYFDFATNEINDVASYLLHIPMCIQH